MTEIDHVGNSWGGDKAPEYTESALSTLSYLINLQETKLEHENKEETYLNQETTQLIEDRKEVSENYLEFSLTKNSNSGASEA